MSDTSLTNFAIKILNNNEKRYYRGRKGIEPAGAKGVYVLKPPTKEVNDSSQSHNLRIINDMTRQRRQDFLNKGQHPGVIEATHVYPMLGGRNIKRWKIESNEFILVPHSATSKYGIAEIELLRDAPLTYEWLSFYRKELLASRIQNGKFFNEEKNPFYRLDNIGEYSFSPYKVLWKEQTGSMSAVVIGNYSESIPNYDPDLLPADTTIMVDSKILFLALDKLDEAHYVCGLLNSPSVRKVIDAYAISTNRGTDVLKYLAIPKFDLSNSKHCDISALSKVLHEVHKQASTDNTFVTLKESDLEAATLKLFS